MTTPSMKVMAIQLRQIQSQLEAFLEGGSQSVWQMKDAPVAFLATIQTRLDDARHAVNMARLRAEQELKAVEGPLPMCANDGKRDPKPDSGDDPRWQGPEYDKYECRDAADIADGAA